MMKILFLFVVVLTSVFDCHSILGFSCLPTDSNDSPPTNNSPPSDTVQGLPNPLDVPELETDLTSKQIEIQRDKIRAQSLFALAKIDLANQRYSESLQKLKRAFRYDPQPVILEELTQLAILMRDLESASQYVLWASLKATDTGRPANLVQIDERVLITVATYLTNQQRDLDAITVYEKWQELPHHELPDFLNGLVEIEIGRLAARQTDYEKSAEAYQNLLDLYNDKTDIKLSLNHKNQLIKEKSRTFAQFADSFRKSGQIAKALELYSLANDSAKDPARWLYHQSLIAFDEGEHRKAFDLSLQCIKLNPSGSLHLRACTQLETTAVRILENQNQQQKRAGFENLAKLIKPIVEKRPSRNLVALYTKQLYRSGERESARKILLAETSTKLSAQVGLELANELSHVPDFQLFLISLLQSEKLENVRKIVQAINMDPTFESTLIDSIIDQIKGPAKDRLTGESSATTTDLEFVAAVIATLQSERLNQESNATKTEFEKERLLWRTAINARLLRDNAYSTWAEFLADRKDYQSAKSLMEEAISNEEREGTVPNSSRFKLAVYSDQCGDSQTALTAINQLLQQHPKSETHHYQKGLILYHSGDFQAAKKEWEQVLAILNKPTRAQRKMIRDTNYMLANVEYELGDFSASQELLESLLDDNPADIQIQNSLAYKWAQQGIHLHRSLAMIENAVNSEPENPSYLDSLGSVCFHLKQYDQAIAHLDKALSLDQDNPIIWEHLGDSCAAIGRTQKARKAWITASQKYAAQDNRDKSLASLEKANRLKQDE